MFICFASCFDMVAITDKFHHLLITALTLVSKELFTMKLIEMVCTYFLYIFVSNQFVYISYNLFTFFQVVVGAMRPPDGSSKAMTGRFIRHFNTINIDLFQDHTITSIFSRIGNYFLFLEKNSKYTYKSKFL